jgi:hypothetical protein
MDIASALILRGFEEKAVISHDNAMNGTEMCPSTPACTIT